MACTPEQKKDQRHVVNCADCRFHHLANLAAQATCNCRDCGEIVLTSDLDDDCRCSGCVRASALAAREAALRAEGWNALGRVLGEAQKRIPGMKVEVLR